MRILNENELLQIEVRKQIIDEIMAPENQGRKAEAFKRYMCYKDQTSSYVIDQLSKQFDQSTLQEMAYAIANISLVRKCIDKLAKVYSQGVRRSIEGNEKQSQRLEQASKALNLNTQMKQANRYLKLYRNTAVYVKPCPQDDKWTIKVEPLSPYLYDVVEDYYDRTKPMAYVLSDYEIRTTLYTSGDAATANRTTSVMPLGINKGNNIDEKIADTPSDAKEKNFVWWTKSYHFTTNALGEIISGESMENMIGELPIINMAIDQDGQFWAMGGNDLVDGAILINSVLTHNQHVAVTQGYGQFYMKGKKLPTNVKIGPSKAILMEYEEGEPAPDLGFVSANPNLDALRGLVEQYIALLLTTNNLSTSSVASQLSGQALAPSGIAMVIDKAESMEDVSEQRQMFADKEPQIWRVISKWMNALNDNLDEKIKAVSIQPAVVEDLVLKFNEPQVIVSEAEKLQNLKARKELGIDSMIDLMMKDNPDMTKQQAEEKLKEILAEKIVESMDKPEDENSQDYSSDLGTQLNDRPKQ